MNLQPALDARKSTPMKLLNLDKAAVPKGKLTSYLLSRTHRDGRHKAVFFLRKTLGTNG
jgi:hypothetical protein